MNMYGQKQMLTYGDKKILKPKFKVHGVYFEMR